MTERRRAPIEVLERLAEAVDKQDKRYPGEVTADVRDALNVYRAATAPLRTRASVDAEMGRIVRSSITRGLGVACSTIDELARLCSEPTADDPEAESIQERHERMNMAGIGKMFDTLGKKWAREPNATTDHDADTREPELCGCEEAEALRERLVAIRKVCESFTCSVCAVDVLAILGPP